MERLNQSASHSRNRAFHEGPCLAAVLCHFLTDYCMGFLFEALQHCPFLLWWVYVCCKGQTKSYLAKKDMMSRPEGRLSAATGPQNQGGEERSCSQVGDFSEDFIMLFPAARCFCCEPHQKHLYPHNVFVGCAGPLEFIECFQRCIHVRLKRLITAQMSKDDCRTRSPHFDRWIFCASKMPCLSRHLGCS